MNEELVIKGIVDYLKKPNKSIANQIYLYNNPRNKTQPNAYFLSTLINNKTMLIGCGNVLIGQKLTLKMFLILKKFKFKTLILDIKDNYINEFKKQIPSECYVLKKYVSTNNSSMNLIHVDLTKLENEKNK